VFRIAAKKKKKKKEREGERVREYIEITRDTARYKRNAVVFHWKMVAPRVTTIAV
jgi:hypothetical protein